MGKKPTYPTKRYRYDCKCGKDPMHGTLAASPAMEQHLFNVLDLGWSESHNRPGCGLRSKTVELHNRKAATP